MPNAREQRPDDPGGQLPSFGHGRRVKRTSLPVRSAGGCTSRPDHHHSALLRRDATPLTGTPARVLVRGRPFFQGKPALGSFGRSFGAELRKPLSCVLGEEKDKLRAGRALRGPDSAARAFSARGRDGGLGDSPPHARGGHRSLRGPARPHRRPARSGLPRRALVAVRRLAPRLPPPRAPSPPHRRAEDSPTPPHHRATKEGREAPLSEQPRPRGAGFVSHWRASRDWVLPDGSPDVDLLSRRFGQSLVQAGPLSPSHTPLSLRAPPRPASRRPSPRRSASPTRSLPPSSLPSRRRRPRWPTAPSRRTPPGSGGASPPSPPTGGTTRPGGTRAFCTSRTGTLRARPPDTAPTRARRPSATTG